MPPTAVSRLASTCAEPKILIASAWFEFDAMPQPRLSSALPPMLTAACAVLLVASMQNSPESMIAAVASAEIVGPDAMNMLENGRVRCVWAEIGRAHV